MPVHEIPNAFEHYGPWHTSRDPYVLSIKQHLETGSLAATAVALGLNPVSDVSTVSQLLRNGKVSSGILDRIQEHLGIPHPYLPANGEYSIEPPFTLDWFRREWLADSDTAQAFLREAAVGGAAAQGKWQTFRIAQHKCGREVQAFLAKDIPTDPDSAFSLHMGKEVVYVLSGELRLEYWCVDESVSIPTGGVVFFDSGHPHRLIATEEHAEALFVVTNPWGISYEAMLAYFPTPYTEPRLGSFGVDCRPLFRDGRAAFNSRRKADNAVIEQSEENKKRGINPPEFENPVERVLSIRTIAAVLSHPCWQGIARTSGLSEGMLRGNAVIPLDRASKVASLLGYESVEPLLRPLDINKMVNMGHTDQLTVQTDEGNPDAPGSRLSHEIARQLGHLEYANIFDPDAIRTRRSQMYPHIMTVTTKARDPYPEAHVDGDIGIECAYVCEGAIALRFARDTDNGKEEICGEFHEGDCVLFEADWRHGWGCVGDKPAKLLLCYFSRWGGYKSYRQAPGHPQQVSGYRI